VHATRAAAKEGVVACGGVTLLYASKWLDGLNPENDDQKVGIDILRRALRAPARQIFANAGEDGSVIVGKLLEKDAANHGFDAQSGTYVDMVEAGIIDPTKVVRLALQGAASVAGLLVTTEVMVADKPQKGAPAMPGAPFCGLGGMGGMDFKSPAAPSHQRRLSLLEAAPVPRDQELVCSAGCHSPPPLSYPPQLRAARSRGAGPHPRDDRGARGGGSHGRAGRRPCCGTRHTDATGEILDSNSV
jgi:hypothetical protein